MTIRRGVFVGLTLVSIAMAGRAEDWPQFRGPSATGLTSETNLPAEWNANTNIKWKVKIPGAGWSQPVIVGDKIFLTTAVSDKQVKPKAMQFGGGRPPGGGGGEKGRGMGRGGSPPDAIFQWEVICLDRATGKQLWKKVAAEHRPTIPTHGTNTYASETPVTDGERLFVYFGMTGLYCYDLSGKEVWKKELGTYPMMAGWGTGSSPVLVKDKLILQCDNEEKSFIVAFDKNTGSEVWRIPREEKSSWSTPYVWKNKIRTELVTAGNQKARSYDPATGKLLWELGPMNGRCSATPVGDDALIYFGVGGGRSTGPLYAVRAGASGDVSLNEGEKNNKFIAWVSAKGGPPLASPLLYQGLLYVPEQRGGLITCYDAAKGEVKYNERIPGARGITSSPWASDGKVFCLDEDGKTFVIKAGPEFKILGENKLDEMFWSSAAISDGALYLRGVDHLYCIKK